METEFLQIVTWYVSEVDQLIFVVLDCKVLHDFGHATTCLNRCLI